VRLDCDGMKRQAFAWLREFSAVAGVVGARPGLDPDPKPAASALSVQLAKSVQTAYEPFAAARSHAAKLDAALSSDQMLRKPHTEIE
jgi:hypothetical protein